MSRISQYVELSAEQKHKRAARSMALFDSLPKPLRVVLANGDSYSTQLTLELSIAHKKGEPLTKLIRRAQTWIEQRTREKELCHGKLDPKELLKELEL